MIFPYLTKSKSGYTHVIIVDCLLCIHLSVIRSSVPKLLLDSAFEQKNEIAKAVDEELEKVLIYI